MYSEWDSLENDVVDLSKCKSVLHSYPPNVGRDVAKTVITSIIQKMTTTESKMNDALRYEGSQFSTKADVDWCMQVICFGLSLTLSEIETLRNCVSVYKEWLTVASNGQTIWVPKPLKQNPMFYTQQMLLHLQNLFIPRSDGEVLDQMQLCVPVLLNVESIACESPKLDRDTWESVIKFLLNICNTLLGPPSQANSLGSHLCKQLMHTLVRVWLSAATHCFPTPSLWKTAQNMFIGWRHHLHVIDCWCRATAALTSRVTVILYGPRYPKLSISDADLCFTMKEASDELVVQAWFRFMHMISNPVDLSIPSRIAATPRFYESVLHNDGILDPAQHPCLGLLPQIFLRAIKGVSLLVDAFLGMSNEKHYEVNHTPVLSKIANPETPTNLRKTAKAPNKKSTSQLNSSAPTKSTIPAPSLTSQPLSVSSPDMSPKLIAERPLCNSVLNLYGQWLFDAALAGCKLEADLAEKGGGQRSRSSSSAFPTVPQLSEAAPIATNPMFDMSETTDTFEAGRSEACAILCRIFSTKKTGEHILPTYLSRFYLVLSQGLSSSSPQVIASIILNSFDILRIDLPGVNCLVPVLLSTLETVLPDRELYQFQPFVNIVDFRRASLHLLLSMIPLTLHFDELPVQNIQSVWNNEGLSIDSPTTFRSLRLNMIKLLIGALQCEIDSVNLQMILGGFLVALQDSSLFEVKEEKSLSDQSIDDTAPDIDTAYGMFVQCVHLISQRLDTWKSDLNVTLAALQLLCGMAQLKILHNHGKECKQATRELCQYIVQQCERPKPHHKREMHSMIVAAFSTLTTWLVEHPHLLDDKACLNEVLEIIELGISGSKSSRYDGSNVAVTKEEKELNPVSMRVLEAAEYSLHCLFENMGAFPSPCGPASLCSLLDERDFVDTDKWSTAMSKFHYVVAHRSILLGILESKQAENEVEKMPSVVMVSRSSSGRRVWSWKFRQTPNVDKLTLEQYLNVCPQPDWAENVGTQPNVQHKTFPEGSDSIPMVKADCSIPLLSEVANEEQTEHMQILKQVIEEQEKYDDSITKSLSNEPDPEVKCIPASPVDDFHSARLLLSHLNLLTLNTVQPHTAHRHGPDLVLLNKRNPYFSHDIKLLDSLPTRNNDTVYVFYTKAGQNTKAEILSNASLSSDGIQQGFIEFILSLGWPIDINSHPGWTGDAATSYKLKQKKSSNIENIDMSTKSLEIFDGGKYALYYANVSTETVFIIPSMRKPVRNAKDGAESSNNSDMLTSEPKLRTTSLRPRNASRSVITQTDAKIAIVWFESYDDIDKFPLQDLLSDTPSEPSDHVGIYIHPLENGLFRLWLHGQVGAKGGLAVPVVSGTTISRRSLGMVVRTATMNLFHRRRLDNDSYIQPHVRRKHKIGEMVSNYERKCTEPDFYTAVFTEN